MTFDPKRRLAMATFKTVLGHDLPAGTVLTVTDEPTAPGEVDEVLANRLFSSNLAGYEDELHATPVETPEMERNRLALEAVRDAKAARNQSGEPDAPLEITPTDDLLVHPDGTPKAGQKVTNTDLRDIAEREGVEVEGDDNKTDLIRKITETRASRAVQNGSDAETEGAGGQGDTAAQATTGPGTGEGADSGSGDAHGEAGEGPSDAE